MNKTKSMKKEINKFLVFIVDDIIEFITPIN